MKTVNLLAFHYSIHEIVHAVCNTLAKLWATSLRFSAKQAISCHVKTQDISQKAVLFLRTEIFFRDLSVHAFVEVESLQTAVYWRHDLIPALILLIGGPNDRHALL